MSTRDQYYTAGKSRPPQLDRQEQPISTHHHSPSPALPSLQSIDHPHTPRTHATTGVRATPRERPQERNARKRAHIGTARDVNGQPPLSERERRILVGEPTRVVQAIRLKDRARAVGIAHAVNARTQCELHRRLDQELAQLRATLIIAPI